MRFLETTKHNSVIGDELSAEVRSLIDGVDRILYLFLKDVVVRCLGLSLLANLNLLFELGEGQLTRLDIKFA